MALDFSASQIFLHHPLADSTLLLRIGICKFSGVLLFNRLRRRGLLSPQ